MRIAFTLLVLLFLSNIPSVYYQLYIIYPWFDVAQHFLGGFFMAMFIWSYFKNHLPNVKFHNLVIVAGITALIGIAWELTEYWANQNLTDFIYRTWQIRAYLIGDLSDTLLDLFLDVAGAITYFLLHLLWHRNAHKA